jgi:hypothetical protein
MVLLYKSGLLFEVHLVLYRTPFDVLVKGLHRTSLRDVGNAAVGTSK